MLRGALTAVIAVALRFARRRASALWWAVAGLAWALRHLERRRIDRRKRGSDE